MRFACIRDLRTNPDALRDAVEHEDIVLTDDGKPFAIAVAIEGDDLDEAVDLLWQVRALRAMNTDAGRGGGPRGGRDVGGGNL